MFKVSISIRNRYFIVPTADLTFEDIYTCHRFMMYFNARFSHRGIKAIMIYK